MLTSLILLLAFLFRFLGLSDYPVSLSMDEIAVGWDANSILATGKDHYGEYLPLVFRSVGDYKTPVAIYLISGSIKAFGLNEFAVRFPSAFFGALTAIVFFIFLKELGIPKSGALAGGVWLAISPMHTALSRTSFDGVIALFFLLVGLAAFLGAVRKKSGWLFGGSIALFAVSFWSYHAERIFVPLLAMFLLIYFREKLKFIYSDRKKLFTAILILVVFAAPFIYLTLSGQGLLGRAGDLWLGRQRQGFSPVLAFWASQYLNYFDFNLWFAKIMNFTPSGYFDLGIMYYADILIFFPGVYFLVKSKNGLLKSVSLFWFLAGPFPGSLTTGGINAGRTLIWLPFFGILIANAFTLINRKMFLIYIPFLLWCIGYFANMFAVNFPKYNADLWHYGYKEVSKYACENHRKYDKIIITDKYGIDWPSVKTIPYLYVLFYCDWNPAAYLTDRNLYNIEFRQPQWRIDSEEENWLLIGSRWDFPENFDKTKIMKTIYFPESAYEPKPAFFFVETKK